MYFGDDDQEFSSYVDIDAFNVLPERYPVLSGTTAAPSHDTSPRYTWHERGASSPNRALSDRYSSPGSPSFSSAVSPVVSSDSSWRNISSKTDWINALDSPVAASPGPGFLGDLQAHAFHVSPPRIPNLGLDYTSGSLDDSSVGYKVFQPFSGSSQPTSSPDNSSETDLWVRERLWDVVHGKLFEGADLWVAVKSRLGFYDHPDPSDRCHDLSELRLAHDRHGVGYESPRAGLMTLPPSQEILSYDTSQSTGESGTQPVSGQSREYYSRQAAGPFYGETSRPIQTSGPLTSISSSSSCSPTISQRLSDESPPSPDVAVRLSPDDEAVTTTARSFVDKISAIPISSSVLGCSVPQLLPERGEHDHATARSFMFSFLSVQSRQSCPSSDRDSTPPSQPAPLSSKQEMTLCSLDQPKFLAGPSLFADEEDV
ncbi:hypothetical protein EUX98_g951 [Antrodiella citrinella]|uniref:Uncharacterized protein n=1 Tax=Antrodiella citrinella TaxID=2447956 RepID=A0A4S4NBA2_9APHY|nr:hypothetical protein EUX98_g951 [Antrodiella citrinella]